MVKKTHAQDSSNAATDDSTQDQSFLRNPLGITPGFLLVGSEKYKSQDIHCKQIIIYVIVHDISLRALCPIFRTVADSCIHCSLMISTGMGGSLGRFAYSDRITRYL